ncbi:M23 family metallopeptidase [Elizabethkingia anophelis]|uniref:M23 family metallopeptidase n=1 Tax=Elizabethkingia anophelis TaxID=1117645 RepID=UPI003018F437|nr:M23 family metallopeptidase [Elizabethkingia meningoseptica]
MTTFYKYQKLSFLIISILCLLAPALSARCMAQFNTLTYTKKAELKADPIPHKENEGTGAQKELERKLTWKKIFGSSTTKADLKKEIDSLKSLIIQVNTTKNEKNKINFKKVEDSLIQFVKEKMRKNTVSRSNSYKKLDFVNEDLEMSENKMKVSMPLNNKLVVTSPFSMRTHPIFGFQRMHNGVDLKANYEQIRSVLGGIVTATGWDPKGGGNFMKISHSGRFETSYLHLSEIYYKAGEYVNAGFIIGKSGNSGNSTGPHLHFAVKEYGKYINPIHFLNDLIKVNNLISTYYDNNFANR